MGKENNLTEKSINRLRLFSVVSIQLLLISIIFTYIIFQRYTASSKNKFLSNQAALELRFSSEDLTRLARVYSVTGKAIYEKQYWEILDIRNGKKPRRGNSYTFVLPESDENISLKQLMIDLNFTDKEFQLLKTAEDNSNALVWTETLAFNAIKGLFPDEFKKFTIKKAPNFKYASKIMHNEKYHQNKELIMRPIREFLKVIESRTQKEEKKYQLFTVIAFSVSLVIALITFGILLVYSKITKKFIVQINNQSMEINRNSEQLKEKSIKQEKIAETLFDSIKSIENTMMDLLEGTSRASSIGDKSFLIARECESSSKNLRKSIKEIGSVFSDLSLEIIKTIEKMSSIGKITLKIGDKTKVINKIVAETRILSFNASIEAAHAKEFGKGFLIVSEQISSLANMSGQASNDIFTLLEESKKNITNLIQEAQENIKKATESTNSKIVEGGNKSDNLITSLSSIIECNSDTTKIIKDINKAHELARVKIKDIVQSIDDLKK